MEQTTPTSSHGLRRGLLGSLRRALSRDLGVATNDRVGTLTDRVRLMARWVETAAEMVRAEHEESARALLAGFLRESLRASSVRFVPEALAGDRRGAIRLKLVSSREVAEVTLNEGAEWDKAMLSLAEAAALTTDGVIAAMSRLREAQTLSFTDPLTGLYNRRSLEKMLEREVLLAGRHHQPLSLVVIDVDHFKSVNDSFGHAAGDDLLRYVAKTLTETLRRTDLAFRNGGDEFVILLPQTTLNNALAAMEKVRRSLAQGTPERHAAKLPSPTLSIGVAELWRGCAAPELLRAADSALYRAKRESRNCVRAHAAAA